ncbi:FAD-dependent oxidoreductase [Hydrogenophaga crocea]|uniref:FAD-dependent oxidoreductase n=1 Tax=Hydrogenophaga crocea TaxID=2716225 RepID=A0A6G8IEI2_9BURK|nr:FAD-dependent oxidoreductase [Hydrogenophaga crocea]QIM51597.1 FAD-dependent oxidoreductase [Hydrogenophaga crocea]
MSTLVDRIYAQARITPVRQENRVRSIKRLESGALEVTQQSGAVFTVSQDEPEFQAFVVWMVLNTDA